MSQMLDRMFDALSNHELSALRADCARLYRERDTYLESLQHMQSRADQLAAKNRELARLLPVALAAASCVEYLAACRASGATGDPLPAGKATPLQALSVALRGVEDLVRNERQRSGPTKPRRAP